MTATGAVLSCTVTLALQFWVLSLFFFKQKTAYEMLSGDWSSDVCSSDLSTIGPRAKAGMKVRAPTRMTMERSEERRVGKECRLTWRARWEPADSKKKH